MAKANFEACLAHIFASEGGYVDHPKDPGGATNLGITLATLTSWRGQTVTKAQVKALTRAEAAEIYRKNYWAKIRGDDLPAGLDLVAFDACVNSGAYRAALWLQKGLGVTADGAIGPKTLAAAHGAMRGVVIPRSLQARKNFLLSLSTWRTFGNGWSRRLVSVEAAALKMARGA